MKCVRVPQEIHVRPYLHNDLVMIIDSDMFLVKNFSVAEYLKGYDISGVLQQRGHVTYLWNGILFFNMKTLPEQSTLNFNCGWVDGELCDVGGHTYFYFKKHPKVRLKPVGGHCFVNAHIHQKDQSFFHPFLKLMLEKGVTNSEFFLDFTLFHYRGGGNWDSKSKDYHRHKTQGLHQLIEYAMEQ